MDPRLLRLYEQELHFVREMGGEFARQYPKIAGRLGLEGLECVDPYVERLLESFAFLTARVQLKLEDSFPRFSQHLLEMVYPHYLAPTPSMAVVQIKPSLGEGVLADGFEVPRASVLRSVLGKGEQTACEYRTAHAVTLWPVQVAAVQYNTFVADVAGSLPPQPERIKASLRLRLQTTAGLRFDQLSLDRLPLFVGAAAQERGARLYEQLMGRAVGVVLRPTASGLGGAPLPDGNSECVTLAASDALRPMGFRQDEALLPFGPRSFQGYRLLHEYFAFPQRFGFVALQGLAAACRRWRTTELEVVVLMSEADSTLENAVSASDFGLFCTPAINLFERRADRIHLSDSDYEYHIVPDRTRPMDFEVYQVGAVTGYGDQAVAARQFLPFYGFNSNTGAGGDHDVEAYYTLHRSARLLSARQRAQGTRSSYVGSEVFISLVDGDEGPFRSNLKQLAVDLLCTNRDLPLHMPTGLGNTDFSLQAGAPVESVRCLAGPTAPRPSHAHGDTAWRLISHLTLNYLSLTDGEAGEGAAALRELLSLYADLGDLPTRRQIDGVMSATPRSITLPLPVEGPVVFGRGLEVQLRCDEAAFEGAGVFLFGSVLEQFFAQYVSLNSFTQTVLHTVQRGEIMRWPARLGGRLEL